MSNPCSALNGAISNGYVTVQDTGLRGMISVRADLGDKSVIKALHGESVDVPAPLTMSNGGISTAWMAPDELLILTGYTEANAVAARLENALKDSHALIHVVSDARACITLSGGPVREVLAKLSPIDMASLKPGMIRRTRAGQVAIAVWLEDDMSAHVICFRSVAPYLFDALARVSRTGSEVFGAA